MKSSGLVNVKRGCRIVRELTPVTASFVGAHLLADNLLLQSWEICDLNLPAKLVARGLYYGKVVSSLWLAENQIVPVPVGVSPKKQSEVQYPGPRFLW